MKALLFACCVVLFSAVLSKCRPEAVHKFEDATSPGDQIRSAHGPGNCDRCESLRSKIADPTIAVQRLPRGTRRRSRESASRGRHRIEFDANNHRRAVDVSGRLGGGRSYRAFVFIWPNSESARGNRARRASCSAQRRSSRAVMPDRRDRIVGETCRRRLRKAKRRSEALTSKSFLTTRSPAGCVSSSR